MKKTLKLLTAVLLAAVMTLSMITCAAAVESEESFKGSITVTLERNDKPVKGLEVTLYQVGTGAVENNNWQFALVEALASEVGDLELNGLSAAEVEAITDTLVKHIKKMPAEEKAALTVATKASDENGEIVFDDLGAGVYLAVRTKLSGYEFSPALVYLPYGDETGWDEEIAVNPKVSVSQSSDPKDPPKDPPENPPEIPDEPPPTGNKEYPPGDPGDPGVELPEEEVPLATLPQTGLLQWPIPVMAAAGLLLLGTGMLVERKRRTN